MNAIIPAIVLITKRVRIPLDHFIVYVQLVTLNTVLLAKVSFDITVYIWNPYYFNLLGTTYVVTLFKKFRSALSRQFPKIQKFIKNAKRKDLYISTVFPIYFRLRCF